MFIIWGSKNKEKTVDQGEFYCPNCRSECNYRFQRVVSYFTLYFIPLFQTETLGEYVECDSCHGQFNESIIDYSPEEIESMLEPWLCNQCGNTNAANEPICLGCNAERHME